MAVYGAEFSARERFGGDRQSNSQFGEQCGREDGGKSLLRIDNLRKLVNEVEVTAALHGVKRRLDPNTRNFRITCWAACAEG